jgi:hypothetical protein
LLIRVGRAFIDGILNVLDIVLDWDVLLVGHVLGHCGGLDSKKKSLKNEIQEYYNDSYL